MARKNYDPEVKAAVVAALLEGQSVSSVAKKYNIPKGTVSGWKNARGSLKVATQKNADEIGGLLLGYLEENLKTLRAQAELFRTPKWLMKQNAADAAVLHGVLTDKSMRLLEVMSSEPDNNDTDD